MFQLKENKMKQEVVTVRKAYLMNAKTARREQLSTLGAGHFIGRIIVEVEYSYGGIQSTSIKATKTSSLIKKGDKVRVECTGNYITAMIANKKRLKCGW